MDPELARVPDKLSPFLTDSIGSSSQFLSARSLISLFAPVDIQVEARKKHDFFIPQYYIRSAMNGESELKLKPHQVKQFSLDTLMYCFYYLPSDVLQSVSALELVSRNWKYHPELNQWFRPTGSEDGLPPQMFTGGQKHYMTFDVPSWTQKLWTGSIDASKFQTDYSLSPKAPALNGTLRTAPVRHR